MLRQATFILLFRRNEAPDDPRIDALEPLEPLAPEASGDEAVAEIFAEIGSNRLTAARKVLGTRDTTGECGDQVTAPDRPRFGLKPELVCPAWA